MAAPVYPPQAAVNAVQTAVTQLYAAVQVIEPLGTAPGNVNVVNGALTELGNLLVSWMVTGVS